jgi:hypothetical protein
VKKYTHAWLALKAVDQLKYLSGRFNEERNARLERFLKFICNHPGTFVRGAWFPDTIVRDNTQGGHTWKYYLDSDKGRTVSYRPPAHNMCLPIVEDALGEKVSLDTRTSDLPDRSEALSQTIRDTILITNKVHSGDVIVFNDSQAALFFLMLAHYVCDAHVPVHCDKRDFYTPSKVHPDLEYFWEKEIKKHYKVSTKTEQFDLDENGSLQMDTSRRGFDNSILHRCDEILEESTWDYMADPSDDWRTFLGDTNNNFWDYLVSVCLVSFHMSLEMFPIDPPDGVDYDTVRIMQVSPFKETVIEHSPRILADAINSVALLWLAAWERWELLAKGIR